MSAGPIGGTVTLLEDDIQKKKQQPFFKIICESEARQRRSFDIVALKATGLSWPHMKCFPECIYSGTRFEKWSFLVSQETKSTWTHSLNDKKHFQTHIKSPPCGRGLSQVCRLKYLLALQAKLTLTLSSLSHFVTGLLYDSGHSGHLSRNFDFLDDDLKYYFTNCSVLMKPWSEEHRFLVQQNNNTWSHIVFIILLALFSNSDHYGKRVQF